jgi:hypothetical protein
MTVFTHSVPYAVLGLLFACGTYGGSVEGGVDSGTIPPQDAGRSGGDAASTSDSSVAEVGADAASCEMLSCIGTGCVSTCMVVPRFATLSTRGVPALANLSVIAPVVGTTHTGQISGLRATNANPTQFEVIAGIGFVLVSQGTSPSVGVWVVANGAIGARLTFAGSAAAAVVATGDLEIASTGTIDVNAVRNVAGPGGFAGGTYGAAGLGCGGAPKPPGIVGTGTNGGGGGGSYGSVGGVGGTGFGAGGVVSPACGALTATSALVGGSGGAGADDGSGASGIFGGGGGGALQLTALGTLRITGTLLAGGGAGRTPLGNSRSGSGGGSGGTLLLEGSVVRIDGALYANGGGGGGGSAGTGTACTGAPVEGVDGTATSTPASGSRCVPAAPGGNGAGGPAVAVAGGARGGGGGGHGRIVLHSFSSVDPSVNTTTYSPSTAATGYDVSHD